MKEFYVVSKDISYPGYGRYPGSRSVEELIRNGIVILDKWPGITSHKAAEALKTVLGVKKSGHSGTLDPMVSGVLPVALENACKVMPALQGLDKEYTGTMQLHRDANEDKVKAAMKVFIGTIKQVPPVKSAVARIERERKIYSFVFLEKSGRDVLFSIRCQAGTYVRLVCHELGEFLGTGAHMTKLRRTKVGRFDESYLSDIKKIEQACKDWREGKNEDIRNYILPVEAAVEHLGVVIIKDSAIPSVSNGSPLFNAGISMIDKTIARNSLIALMSHKGELIALAKSAMGADEMKLRRGVAAKITRVIIETNL